MSLLESLIISMLKGLRKINMVMYAESINDLRQIVDAFVEKSTLYKNYNILCEQDDKQINIDTEMFLF